MLTFYDIPESLTAEHKQLEKDIAGFLDGSINPVKFKAIRVAFGIYEQRLPNTYMIRIRCAGGGITPLQLKKVAVLAKTYGSGEIHFTTRSEIQLHDILIENIMTVLRELKSCGLSTRGGGGNTVRNILCSTDSGITEDEIFDVEPYAIALTSRMMAESDSWNLPRKFKIAFSNNRKDTAFTQVTCLGFVAKILDGKKGFEVYCAGGMGANPILGNLLFDFVPENKVYHITRALKVMFDKHGNRRSKNTSRIKYLWKKLQREEFIQLFEEEYNKIKDDNLLSLDLQPTPNEAKETSLPIEIISGENFDKWKERYVTSQKQSGLSSIFVSLRLGDLLYQDAVKLTNFLSNFGENNIRCERKQNIRLRNIPEKYLGNAYNLIMGLEQTLSYLPKIFAEMVNCTGAQTCKLGICLPRGLSDAVRDKLITSDLNLENVSDLRIHISGCPNTCGLHHIADLGFFGKVGRNGGYMYPSYNVLAGGNTNEAGNTIYAQQVDEISAKFIPDFLHDFLKVYSEKKNEFKTYQHFLDDCGMNLITILCDKYREVPTFEEDNSIYIDWGASKPLSLKEIGTAECSAGMFDMINVDKKIIKDTQKLLTGSVTTGEKENYLYIILHSACRMLLVTRGLDAKTDKQVFEMFMKHFVTTNLVDSSFMDIVVLGKLGLKSELFSHEDHINELAKAVNDLYSSMDDSLRFNKGKKEEENPEAVQVENVKDFRGVACPMNFVKTKMELSKMQVSEKLEILLDDGAPIENVPRSVQSEGHKILEKEKDGDHWRVLIEKV
ncbi:Ferredoxin--sulfite reductase [hydrothermal vent metagenome]|uniref:Ferredoxin--sulfite reductase n=1 Tax=hydrothermal vent metagenome TaxID=652676 RepID=A0A3B1D4K9_9ZZZZ